MSTSVPNPEIPSESPPKAEVDAPAAAASTKASPEHESTETTPTVLVRDGGSNAGLPIAPGLTIPRPIKTVECNMMSYTDGEGVTWQIYMPKGTAGLAGALYTAKRFDELARFPAWGE